MNPIKSAIEKREKEIQELDIPRGYATFLFVSSVVTLILSAIAIDLVEFFPKSEVFQLIGCVLGFSLIILLILIIAYVLFGIGQKGASTFRERTLLLYSIGLPIKGLRVIYAYLSAIFYIAIFLFLILAIFVIIFD